MRTMCKQSDHHHLYPNAMSGVLYYEGQLLNNNYPATSKELYLPPRYCSLCVDTTTPYSRAVKLVPLQGSPIPFTLANERRADFENDCSAYCDSVNDADSMSCFVELYERQDINTKSLGVCKCYERFTNKVFYPPPSWKKQYTGEVTLDDDSLSRGIFPINEPLINTKVYQSNFVIHFSSY